MVLAACLVLSGLFSAAETALTSLNRVKLRQQQEAGMPSAHLLAGLLEHRQRVLSAILLGNTLCTVAFAVFATSIASALLPRYAIAVAIGAGTLLVLLLGEIVPKSVAANRVEQVAGAIAPPIRLFMVVLSPLLTVLLWIATPLIRLLGGHDVVAGPRYTEDEFRTLMDIGEEEGVLEEEETELIQAALAFDDTTVEEILTPRVDIVALPVDSPTEQALKVVAEQGYSRMPVYRENIDNIVGILHAKDLLLALSRKEPFAIASWLRPPHFIPQNKPLDELLREMQTQEIQMAIVNDEYGGTAGLVTLEDIVEQIVGDIRDEYDEEPVAIRQVGDREVLVDSRTGIDDLNEALDLDLPINGYKTVGGLVLNSLGRVAKVGDVVEVDGISITVKAIKGIRIQQVLLELPTAASSAADTPSP